MALMRSGRRRSIIGVSREEYNKLMKTKHPKLARNKTHCLIVTDNRYNLDKASEEVASTIDSSEFCNIIDNEELPNISRIHVVQDSSLNVEALREVAANLPNVIFTSYEQMAIFNRDTTPLTISEQAEFFQTYNHSGIEYIKFEKDVNYLDFGLIELFQGAKRLTLHDFEFKLPLIVKPKKIEDVCIMGESFYDLPKLIDFKLVKSLHLQNLPKDFVLSEWDKFEEFFKGLNNLLELSLATPLFLYYCKILTWIPSKTIKIARIDCEFIDKLYIDWLAKHKSLQMIVLPSVVKVEYVRNYLDSMIKEGKFRNLSHVCLQTNYYIVKKSKSHRSKGL